LLTVCLETRQTYDSLSLPSFLNAFTASTSRLQVTGKQVDVRALLWLIDKRRRKSIGD